MREVQAGREIRQITREETPAKSRLDGVTQLKMPVLLTISLAGDLLCLFS